jgi:hypothetical protein
MRCLLFPVVVAGLVLVWATPARAQEDAVAVIAKAIKAHGGAAKIDALGPEYTKAKGNTQVGTNEVPFTAETFLQLPDKVKIVINYQSDGAKSTLVQVANGNKGWYKLNGDVEPLDEQTLAETKETLYVDRVTRLTVLLKDRDAFKLSAVEETKVNGKPAAGVKVTSKGHRDVRLYFDKESGLLVKTERRAFDTNTRKEGLQEEVYSNFKEAAGVTRPMKVIFYQDGKKYMEAETTELKYVDKFDDTVFARP